jgi:hypothetical protein
MSCEREDKVNGKEYDKEQKYAACIPYHINRSINKNEKQTCLGNRKRKTREKEQLAIFIFVLLLSNFSLFLLKNI